MTGAAFCRQDLGGVAQRNPAAVGKPLVAMKH